MSEVKHMHQDLEDIKRELSLIRHILAEEYELSNDARAALAKARKTPRSHYLSHEEVKKLAFEYNFHF